MSQTNDAQPIAYDDSLLSVAAPDLQIFKDAGTTSDLYTEPSADDSDDQGHSDSPAGTLSIAPNLSTNETSAVELFEAGVSHEKFGRVYQAIRCYKQALQLFPDVEKYLRHKYTALRNTSLAERPADPEDQEAEDVVLPTQMQLLARFEQRLTRQGVLTVCDLEHAASGTHISKFPPEVVLEIFKHASFGMNAYRLDQLSMVCCGFYKLARHPDLWRTMCIEMWPELSETLQPPYTSWRNMFLTRAHVWFNGLYVSKVSYIRLGAVAYQDMSSFPWYQVVYFRCIRFFPDGTALMVTTADSPKAIVDFLMYKIPKCPNVMYGHYEMTGEHDVLINLCRPVAVQPECTRNRQTKLLPLARKFTLKLKLVKVKRRNYYALRWISYEYDGARVETSSFAVDNPQYPPFFFCRVRKYNV